MEYDWHGEAARILEALEGTSNAAAAVKAVEALHALVLHLQGEVEGVKDVLRQNLERSRDADALLNRMAALENRFETIEKFNEAKLPPLNEDTDAQRWAREFRQTMWDNGYQDVARIDEGWLISWFANAIEAGRTAGLRQGRDFRMNGPFELKPFPGWRIRVDHNGVAHHEPETGAPDVSAVEDHFIDCPCPECHGSVIPCRATVFLDEGIEVWSSQNLTVREDVITGRDQEAWALGFERPTPDCSGVAR